MTILLFLLAVIGAICCPVFTLGCVLIYFDMHVIGWILIILSFFITRRI